MGQAIEIATGFPAVIWTVLMLTSIGFWVVSSALGLSGGGIDGDVGDIDDSAVDGLGDALSALGLAHAPLSVVFTFLSMVGWLFTMLLVGLVGSDVSMPTGLVILLVSVVVGIPLTGRLARVVAPLYDSNRGLSHDALLGKLCTVRTRRVDRTFGQAEIIDESGSSHLVQVRCRGANDLSRGSRALVVDVDDGIFQIDPDVAGLDQP